MFCNKSPAKVNSSAKFRKSIDMGELFLVKSTRDEQKKSLFGT